MDFDRILAVKQDAQARLRAIPGVHAVAIGPKVVGGQTTGEPAILVYLVAKRPLSDIPAGECIPGEIDGMKTDVIEQPVPRYHTETAEGGLEISAKPVDGSGTLGCIAVSHDKTKIYALTCNHVVQPSEWQPSSLTVSSTAAGGAARLFTFGGFIRDGDVVLVQFTPTFDGPSAYEAYYGVKDADTLSTVAAGVVAAVTAMGMPNFTAVLSGSEAVKIDAGPGGAYICFCLVLGHFEYPQPDLRVGGSGTDFTFSGTVSGDYYGVFTIANAGGPVPAASIFTALPKGTTPAQVAQKVAADVTSMGVSGISGTQTGTTVHIDGAVETYCVITRDTRIGQPCICSVCSKCCGVRIGVVAQSRMDVDTALIQLDAGLDYLAEIDGIDGWVTGSYAVQASDIMSTPPNPPPPPYLVKKSGFTTNLTNGRITSLHKDGFLDRGPSGERHYSGAMNIQSTDSDPFSKAGDSGSAVLNIHNQVVAILFGGSDTDTLATPIQSITQLFQIDIATATAAGQHQTVPGVAFSAVNAPVRVPAMAAATPGGLRSLAMRAREAQNEIMQTAAGREYADAVRRHAPEVQQLIDTNRRVATVWQRCGGPRMIEALFAMLHSRERAVPTEIEGKPLPECIARIQTVMQHYASPALAQALREYAPRLSQLGGLNYAQLIGVLQPEGGAPSGL